MNNETAYADFERLINRNGVEYRLVQPLKSRKPILIRAIPGSCQWQIVAGTARVARTGQLWVYDANHPEFPDYYIIKVEKSNSH